MSEIAGAAREGLLAMSVAAGMAVMLPMFEAELAEACGPKGARDSNRAAVRHGRGPGSVTLGGCKVAVIRARARTTDGHEVPLASYTHFAAEDVLTRVVMERMLAGVATRRHARTAEPVSEQASGGAQKSTSKSAVSRRFVEQTETALAELMARELTGEDIKGARARWRAHGRMVCRGRAGDHRGRHQEAGRAVGGLHGEQDRGPRPAGRHGRPGPVFRR